MFSDGSQATHQNPVPQTEADAPAIPVPQPPGASITHPRFHRWLVKTHPQNFPNMVGYGRFIIFYDRVYHNFRVSHFPIFFEPRARMPISQDVLNARRLPGGARAQEWSRNGSGLKEYEPKFRYKLQTDKLIDFDRSSWLPISIYKHR